MEHSDRLEERIKNRRARRWKRRARIIGPFLAIPLLFATLVLSIDLIEYERVEPEATTPKVTARKLDASAAPTAPYHAAREVMATSSIPNPNVVTGPQIEGSLQRAIDMTPVLPKPNELRPPIAPSPLQSR